METKTRGAPREFFPNDVLEILKDGPAKRDSIANKLGCSTQTVYNLVVKLIDDGSDVGFNGQGYFLLDKNTLSEEDWEKGRAWTDRVYNMFVRLARRASAHVPVAKLLRQRFAGELTREERGEFKKELLLLTRAIDAIDLDEELAEQ
jgi:biotin operon repressor